MECYVPAKLLSLLKLYCVTMANSVQLTLEQSLPNSLVKNFKLGAMQINNISLESPRQWLQKTLADCWCKCLVSYICTILVDNRGFYSYVDCCGVMWLYSKVWRNFCSLKGHGQMNMNHELAERETLNISKSDLRLLVIAVCNWTLFLPSANPILPPLWQQALSLLHLAFPHNNSKYEMLHVSCILVMP